MAVLVSTYFGAAVVECAGLMCVGDRMCQSVPSGRHLQGIIISDYHVPLLTVLGQRRRREVN